MEFELLSVLVLRLTCGCRDGGVLWGGGLGRGAGGRGVHRGGGAGRRVGHRG